MPFLGALMLKWAATAGITTFELKPNTFIAPLAAYHTPVSEGLDNAHQAHPTNGAGSAAVPMGRHS